MYGPHYNPMVRCWAVNETLKAPAGSLWHGRPHLEYKPVLAPHDRSHKDTVQLLVILFRLC